VFLALIVPIGRGLFPSLHGLLVGLKSISVMADKDVMIDKREDFVF
jgi:hypothetical protein